MVKNNNIKGFREELKYLEDNVFYLDNLSKKGVKIINIPEKLYIYKYNAASKTKSIDNYQQNFKDLVESGKVIAQHKSLTKRQARYARAKACDMIFWKAQNIAKANGKEETKRLIKIGYKNLRNAKLKPSIITPKSLLKYYLIKIKAIL